MCWESEQMLLSIEAQLHVRVHSFNAQQHLFWIYERSKNEFVFYCAGSRLLMCVSAKGHCITGEGGGGGGEVISWLCVVLIMIETFVLWRGNKNWNAV